MKANNLLAKNCTARGVSLIYKLPVFRDQLICKKKTKKILKKLRKKVYKTRR